MGCYGEGPIDKPADIKPARRSHRRGEEGPLRAGRHHHSAFPERSLAAGSEAEPLLQIRNGAMHQGQEGAARAIKAIGRGVPSASTPYNWENTAAQKFCMNTPMPAAVPAKRGIVRRHGADLAVRQRPGPGLMVTKVPGMKKVSGVTSAMAERRRLARHARDRQQRADQHHGLGGGATADAGRRNWWLARKSRPETAGSTIRIRCQPGDVAEPDINDAAAVAITMNAAVLRPVWTRKALKRSRLNNAA